VGRGKMGTTTPKQASTTTRVISPIVPIRRALPGNPDDIERWYPALGGACKRSIHEADIEDKYTRHIRMKLEASLALGTRLGRVRVVAAVSTARRLGQVLAPSQTSRRSAC
jgi:hypothetical protein